MKIFESILLNANRLLLFFAILLFSCKGDNEQIEENVIEEVEEYTFFDPDNPLNVSSCDAENVACAFMQSDRGDNTQKASGISYSIQKLTVIPDENMEPAMYVINLEPDGFCIVSATKQVDPILAYCDKGSFCLEKMSTSLADWLYEEMEKIQYVRNDTSYIVPERVAAAWHKYINFRDKRRYLPGSDVRGENYTIGPLLKTSWGQGHPYNYYMEKKCPNLEEYIYLGKYPAGCVATALAQVLKYNAYPENKYKWAKMKSIYYSDSPMDEGAKSMANLFYDLGKWLNMKYGCEGSEAFATDIPDVLEKKFNYVDGGEYKKLTEEEAAPIVANEIKNGRLVIMDGYGSLIKKRKKIRFWKYDYIPDDGHCWVCDGYKQILSTILFITYPNGETKSIKKYVNQSFYHMNWGADGFGMGNYDNNGWFSLGNIEINDPEFNNNYQYSRGYLIGIKAR